MESRLTPGFLPMTAGSSHYASQRASIVCQWTLQRCGTRWL